jgi:hypothetical protein
LKTLLLALALVGADDLEQIRDAIQRQVQVKSADCAVYRPASLRFSDLVLMGADVVQQVHVTDRTGAAWIAYYAMQRQDDGRWRASGCRVVQPSRTISA